MSIPASVPGRSATIQRVTPTCAGADGVPALAEMHPNQFVMQRAIKRQTHEARNPGADEPS